MADSGRFFKIKGFRRSGPAALVFLRDLKMALISFGFVGSIRKLGSMGGWSRSGSMGFCRNCVTVFET